MIRANAARGNSNQVAIMKAQRISALLILTVVGIGPSLGANWTQFSISNSGNKGFIDYDRIKRDSAGANTYTAWWRTELAKTATINRRPYRSHLGFYRVDCDKSLITSLAIHYYDAKGSVVFSDEEQAGPSIAVPDTLGEIFVNAVCSAAKIRGI